MTTVTANAFLAQMIRDVEEGWLLRIGRTEEESIALVRKRLDAAYRAYSEMFPDPRPGEPAFDDDALRTEMTANPHRIRALLQAIGASSPPIIALIWRVILGDTIKQIDMRYRFEEAFELRVVVENELAEREAEFTSKSILDATFLRHLSILFGPDDKPIFDGYYALNLAK